MKRGFYFMKEAKLKKESGKIFTKERRNSRIKKNYNPLKVNYKIYKRGSGLYMEKERISKKKKFVDLLFKICLDLGVKDSQEQVENFLNKNKRDD